MTGSKVFAPLLLTVAASVLAPSAQAAAPDGAAVYGKYCATCHDQVGPRIPQRSALQQMSPGRILRTLDFGAMMSIAYPIKREDREAVAHYLGTGAEEPPPPQSAFCKADRPFMSAAARDSWAGWSPAA